jgi:ribonuclease HII
VVAAAAIIPPDTFIPHLNDSKKLTPKQRVSVYEQIQVLKIPYGIGQASVGEIDRLNILQASRLAMMRAVHNLPVQPDFLLLDGYAWPGIDLPHRGVIGGDALSMSIAAASVLAKVTRDRIMIDLDRAFPGYGFAKHKGYPTAQHYAALARFGPTPVHRRSFNLHLQLPLGVGTDQPLEVKKVKQ